MKPYAFNPNSDNDTGCCPGHDWPRLYRWSGRYSSVHSRRVDTVCNKISKRNRRRTDRLRLRKDGNDELL